MCEQDVFSFYPNFFSCGQNDIDLMKNVFHSIVTTTGKPVSLPTRRIPLHQEEEVNKMIQDLLDSGIIERSESPYNSPLVIVKKKSGQLRLVLILEN